MVDSREKYPLLFPTFLEGESCRWRVRTKVCKLEAGDYALAEDPTCCIIERKASTRELAKNLFDRKDQLRQIRALNRLREACRTGYLLVELSPSQLLRPSPDTPHPEVLLSRLAKLLTAYPSLHLFLSPFPKTSSSKRNLGRVALTLMLAYFTQVEEAPAKKSGKKSGKS